MGSLFSSSAAPKLSSSEPSKVKTFLSSSEWKNHFNTTIKESSSLVVIYFYATWCGPCKFFHRFFDDLSNKFTDVSFIKIDVDELADVAKEYDVKAMPTFVLLIKGEQIDKVVGAEKDEIIRKIELNKPKSQV